MNMLILVVDDEPDVEVLFRQQFRRICAKIAFRWNLRNPVRWHFNASRPQATVHSF